MKAALTTDQRDGINSLLALHDIPKGAERRFELLSGDGSDRCFIRVSVQGSTYIAIIPSGRNVKGKEEAYAYFRIAGHLYGKNVPVPRVYGFDGQSAIVLCEDLGDTLFHTLVQAETIDSPRVRQYYNEIIAGLVRLQTIGKEGFAPQYCWDTTYYDEQLMLEKESAYFVKEFCRGYLGLDFHASSLQNEFKQLASRAAQEPNNFLLHRDFQSRNVMIKDGGIVFIDFQGARFGPLAYDLASLLNDPYVLLSEEMKTKFMSRYLADLSEMIAIDQEAFLEGYYYIALQRNLQILGAFAFLTKIRKKTFFKQYIRPATLSLVNHLSKPAGRAFPSLRDVSGKALRTL